MKHLIFGIIVLVPFLNFSQTDTLNRDRTLDGVHKNSSCVIDTTLVLHEKSEFRILDSSDMSIQFVPGVKTYLEIQIRTTVCWCKDCSFIDAIVIDVTDFSSSLKLTAANTTWITWNSFMIPSVEDHFTGALKSGGGEKYFMEIYKFIPDKPELTYDGVRVEKKLTN